MVKKIFILALVLIGNKAMAQDPAFSQFFSSPMNINPALTGNINGKWRLISNFRKQWINPANPYTTGTISAENKIFQDMPGNEDENTRLAIGGMFMYDEAMAGALKSNYGFFNVAGSIKIGTGNSYVASNETPPEHRIGVGIGISYGSKQLDYTKLNFAEQFTGNGFDTNLPTGEAGLSNMRPYLSTSAGILYSYESANTTLDIGAGAFHFNKPKQTFLSDPNQYLATRFTVHANMETYISQQVFLNSNGVYQYQSGASYLCVGGALGYYAYTSDEKDIILNAGLWYWSKNAIIPYFGFSYGSYQLGLSYDIVTSKLTQGTRKAPTFELCLVFRGGKVRDGAVPAPWK